MSERATSLTMAQARVAVEEWMQAREADLPTASESGALGHGEIVNRFLQWVRHSGFDGKVVEISVNGSLAYEVHWTHRGSSFVGFRQPPPQASAEDAFLLGCAALLENDWCRQRLVASGQ